MGQYYNVINLDKKQRLNPHKLGNGLKLMEFGMSSYGTMTALAVLLADGNGRGGGDLHSDDPLIGSWAGDRIVIAGDYGDAGKFVPEGYVDSEGEPVNLSYYAERNFEDISLRIRAILEKVEGPMSRRWDQ